MVGPRYLLGTTLHQINHLSCAANIIFFLCCCPVTFHAICSLLEASACYEKNDRPHEHCTVSDPVRRVVAPAIEQRGQEAGMPRQHALTTRHYPRSVTRLRAKNFSDEATSPFCGIEPLKESRTSKDYKQGPPTFACPDVALPRATHCTTKISRTNPTKFGSTISLVAHRLSINDVHTAPARA